MDKKTEVQMDKKTKTKKCVYDCDVRAVLHSWDVFFFSLNANIIIHLSAPMSQDIIVILIYVGS